VRNHHHHKPEKEKGALKELRGEVTPYLVQEPWLSPE